MNICKPHLHLPSSKTKQKPTNAASKDIDLENENKKINWKLTNMGKQY